MRINLGTGGGSRRDWRTPRWLFDLLNKEFNFALDAAASPENALCPKFFTEDDDGLKQDWALAVGRGRAVFCNPPYGQKQLRLWMSKALAESTRTTVVMLVPARTDTYWWHDIAMDGEVRFIRSRVNFDGGGRKAPFPSAVVILRPFPGQADGTMGSIFSPTRTRVNGGGIEPVKPRDGAEGDRE